MDLSFEIWLTRHLVWPDASRYKIFPFAKALVKPFYPVAATDYLSRLITDRTHVGLLES